MYRLPDLKFKPKELDNFLSDETIAYHYGKHHKSYIEKLNSLLEKSSFANRDCSLEEIITKSEGALYNNAAQAWNHTFYWNTITGDKNTLSDNSPLHLAILNSFGTHDELKNQFIACAKELLGSGWVWIIKNKNGELSVMPTRNADTPFTSGRNTPLLVCDVWEHAYYIDYRNRKEQYLEGFWRNIDWRFAEKNYSSEDLPKMGEEMSFEEASRSA